MTKLFIILFSAGITIADEFIPLQNDSLNYTHVLFHWPQISSDITYTITIKNLNNSNQWSTKTSQNTYILEEFLDWGFSYEWQVCYKSIYGDNCFEQQYFTINKLPDYFPNPFNNEVKIQYSLPKSSDLTIEVYNILGQKIDTLFNGFKRLGMYTIKWKANNHPSGIYFVKLATNEYSQSKKLMFIK